MADVAAAAGVAISTVSRALSNPEQVNEATRERIVQAARALSYVPNAMARNLRRGATELAIAAVPGRANSPALSDLLAGVDETMAAAGYRLIREHMDRADEAGRFILDPALSGTVDGVFVVSSKVPQFAHRSPAQMRLPFVGLLFDHSSVGIPSVLIDDRYWAAEAAGRLIALGHRNIAFLAGAADRDHDILRYAGVLDAMDKAGLPRTGVLRIEGDGTLRSGEAAARRCLTLPDRPTAAIGCTDEVAIGFIWALRAAGLAVPGDCSVIGFDGIGFADYCEPILSVVRQPLRDMGHNAAGLMLRRLAGEMPPPIRTLHPCQLLMRASTGPPPPPPRPRRKPRPEAGSPP